MRALLALPALALALLAACATPSSAPPSDASQVVAVERAFAADAAANAWIPAFRHFVAPDATVLRPDPTSANAWLAGLEDDGDRTLAWRPAYAGIARSGDLGFTTGPVRHGEDPKVVQHYFTVWKKQSDGSWKWIYDGGAAVTDPATYNEGAPVLAPTATRGAASPDAAAAEVLALERAHASAAAILPLVAPEAHVNRAGKPPAATLEAARAFYGDNIAYAPISALASAGADLVFTLGDASWREGEAARRGHTVRIWQKHREGWRIVYDQLVPVPPGR